MCTVSWCALDHGGYALLFNRDEQRSRPEALPPAALGACDGLALAPRDPLGGGTWLWTNRHGLTACVLNHYPAQQPPRDGLSFRSRGLLLAGLASASSRDAFLEALRAALAADTYQACFVLCLDPSGMPSLWRWDGPGARLVGEEPHMPITTSSFAPQAVRAARLRLFERLRADHGAPRLAWLAAFHASREGPTGAHAVCMSRPDARTVSISIVEVGPRQTRFAYTAIPETASAWPAPVVSVLPHEFVVP